MQFDNLKTGQMVRLEHPTLGVAFADVTKVESGRIAVVIHGTANRFRFHEDGTQIAQPGLPKDWKMVEAMVTKETPVEVTTGHKRARKGKGAKPAK